MDEIYHSRLTNQNIQLPDFKADHIPSVQIEWIKISNFKAFDDSFFDFRLSGDIDRFICFIGPNGTGKSTILNVIQLIFSNFHGYTKQRIRNNLGRAVRHIDESVSHNDDFLIEAQILSSYGRYTIQITKDGFLKPHLPEIDRYAYRLCYATRFDQELHNFQLKRERWSSFKKLFESVTGFEIEKKIDLFSTNRDTVQNSTMHEYVFDFVVKKTHETISHKECSAGERKLIKSFSSLLNMDFLPQVILIDNVEMHIDMTRHLPFIESLKSQFPDSQIITTTHSYHISRNFSDRSQVRDLRIIRSSDLIQREQWRLYMIDEIEDSMVRLRSVCPLSSQSYTDALQEGKSLQHRLRHSEDSDDLQYQIANFMARSARTFVASIMP